MALFAQWVIVFSTKLGLEIHKVNGKIVVGCARVKSVGEIGTHFYFSVLLYFSNTLILSVAIHVPPMLCSLSF